jgi:putative hemolysin
MLMKEVHERGGGIPGNRYCVYCCDRKGDLKSRDEVREGMIQFCVKTTGKAREEAAFIVDEKMSSMPAWKVWKY